MCPCLSTHWWTLDLSPVALGQFENIFKAHMKHRKEVHASACTPAAVYGVQIVLKYAMDSGHVLAFKSPKISAQ